MLTQTGCQGNKYEGLNIDGLVHDYEPTTSTAFKLAISSEGVWNIDTRFRWNRIQRVKKAVDIFDSCSTTSTQICHVDADCPGVETCTATTGFGNNFESNQFVSYNIPNSIAIIVHEVHIYTVHVVT